MRFYRIGDKVVSREKLLDAVDAILEDREAGATQEEAARAHGVQRSFVELPRDPRRGAPRQARRARRLPRRQRRRGARARRAPRASTSCSCCRRPSARRSRPGPPTSMFNQVLETLAELRDYDVVVLLAQRLAHQDRREDPRPRGRRHQPRAVAAARGRRGRHRPSSTRCSPAIVGADRRAGGAAARGRRAREGRRAAPGGGQRSRRSSASASARRSATTRSSVELLGERFRIRREGTDGDMDEAVAPPARARRQGRRVRPRRHRPVPARRRRDYYFRDAKRFRDAVQQDARSSTASGLKGAVEADVVRYMREDLGLDARGQAGAHDLGGRPVGHGRGASRRRAAR